MDYIQKIKNKLDHLKIQYKLISLPEDLSIDVESHIKFHGIETKQAIPTILFRTEKGLIAVQRRADTKIDNKKLKEVLEVKRLSFASTEELLKLGLESGVVPLVGMDVPIYLDRKVLEVKSVYGGTGHKLFALSFSSTDLQKANNAILADLTIEQTSQNRVLSGIRASGRLHIGNYLGAVKGMLALQEDPSYETFYMVADLHAITTPYDKNKLQSDVRNVIMDYLAAGLDPEKSTIFIQSHIPEHIELAYYFSSLISVAKLSHLPTYKEKIKQYPKEASLALLYYPVLMASDILLYKSNAVPVGDDQLPHLEVTREIARKINAEYGLHFPEPKQFRTEGHLVPSLLGEGKMSKSVAGSYINLTDDLETICQRLAKAPTDSGKGDSNPERSGIANLLTFVELFEGKEKRIVYERQYQNEGIRYKDLKGELAEAIYKELQPIQEKRKELEETPEKVDKIIKEGAEKAREVAGETVTEVKKAMGLLS